MLTDAPIESTTDPVDAKIQQAIAAAVARQRETDAQIAEHANATGVTPGSADPAVFHVQARIAAAIRNGGITEKTRCAMDVRFVEISG